MSAASENSKTDRDTSADAAMDAAINAQLTKRIMENAISDKPEAPAQPTPLQARGIRRLYEQVLTIAGFAFMAVALVLMSFFDREKKLN